MVDFPCHVGSFRGGVVFGDVASGGRVKFHAATSTAFWLEDLRGNWKQAWNKPQFNEGPRASKQLQPFSFPSCKLAK